MTKLTVRTTYRDKASRDEGIQGGFSGVEDSFDQVEDLLRSLLDPKGWRSPRIARGFYEAQEAALTGTGCGVLLEEYIRLRRTQA